MSLALLLSALWLVPNNWSTAQGADPPVTETATLTQTLDATLTLTPTDTPTPTFTQTPDFTATPSATPSPTATSTATTIWHSLYLPFVNRMPLGAVEDITFFGIVEGNKDIFLSWPVSPYAKAYQLWHSLNPDMSNAELLFAGLTGDYYHASLPFGVHYYRLDAMNMWGIMSSRIIHYEIVAPTPPPTLTPLPLTATPVPWTDMNWRRLAFMPIPRYSLNAAIVGGKIYALGGMVGQSTYVPTVAEYDIATNTWRTRADQPTPRINAAAVAANNKIYVIGGEYNNPYGSYYAETWNVEEYNPATDSWQSRAPMSVKRKGVGGAAVGGKIYVVGGVDPATYLLGTLEEYDSSANTWRTRAPMPTPRQNMGVAAVNGKVYAIGGDNDWDTVYATVEEYNPATNTWRARAPMPTARTYLDVVAGSNGKLYALGGCESILCPAGALSTVQEYDPTTDTWRLRSNMLTPRAGFAAVAGPNTKLYVMGGGSPETLEEGTLP